MVKKQNYLIKMRQIHTLILVLFCYSLASTGCKTSAPTSKSNIDSQNKNNSISSDRSKFKKTMIPDTLDFDEAAIYLVGDYASWTEKQVSLAPDKGFQLSHRILTLDGLQALKKKPAGASPPPTKTQNSWKRHNNLYPSFQTSDQSIQFDKMINKYGEQIPVKWAKTLADIPLGTGEKYIALIKKKQYEKLKTQATYTPAKGVYNIGPYRFYEAEARKIFSKHVEVKLEGAKFSDINTRLAKGETIMFDMDHKNLEEIWDTVEESFKNDPANLVSQGTKLGEGSYGTAYQVQGNNGKPFVIKELSLPPKREINPSMSPAQKAKALESNEKRKQLFREVGLLVDDSCPSCLKFFGAKVVGDKLYIASEFAPGGDLDKYIAKEGSVLNQQHITQILKASAELEDLRFHNPDIKPENFVLDTNGNVRMIDLGLAARTPTTFKPAGTPITIAPEVYRGENVELKSIGRSHAYSTASTLLIGLHPKGSTDEFLKRLAETNTSNSRSNFLGYSSRVNELSIPTEDKELLKKMLHRNPQSRITAKEAYAEWSRLHPELIR